MKTNNKRILVLSGLNHEVVSTMKSAVSIAKLINASIDFLYVKKPTAIVDQESQLSAIRSINREPITMQKKVDDIIRPYQDQYNVTIKGKFTYGNVKSEIEKYIQRIEPDLVILGKRRFSPFKIKDIGVTDYVLKIFNGPVLITSQSGMLEPERDLSIAVLKDANDDQKALTIQELVDQTKHPLKSFSVISQSQRKNIAELNLDKRDNEFIFENNDNILNSISNYLEKSKVNLLYLNRNDMNSASASKFMSPKDIIRKINVPLIFGGNKALRLG